MAKKKGVSAPIVARVRAAVARGLSAAPPEKWPTALEVAHALGCSRQHVYRLETRGKLESRDVREHGVMLRRFNPEHVRELSENEALSFVTLSRRAPAAATLMTRGQVARSLGRSLATVRRLEGSLLHPRLLEGVWRFESREVEALADEVRAGRRRLIGDFPISPDPPKRKLPPNTIELCQSCARRAAAALHGRL
jgi:hypothetical protein